MVFDEIYSVYSIVKEISSYFQKGKADKETNFGILVKEYLNNNQLSDSLFSEFRDELIVGYNNFKTPDEIFNTLTKRSFEHTIKRNEKNHYKKSITHSIIMKSLKGNASDNYLKNAKKHLEIINPFFLLLEENIKNTSTDQDLHDVKNLLVNVNFSDDDSLNRKFKRMFYHFIEAYERTPVNVKFLQSYLTNSQSSNYSDILQSMIEKAKENPRKHNKKLKVITECFNVMSNLEMQKADIERCISRHEKNNIEAKKLTQSFCSLKYFIETNSCGTILFLLAWNEKLLDKTYLEDILDAIESNFIELISYGNSV